MSEVLVFLVQVWALLLDPLSLAGYAVAGIVGELRRKIWLALAGGAAWAIAMEILTFALNPGYDGRLAIQRLIGALLCSGIVYAATRMLSRKRSQPS